MKSNQIFFLFFVILLNENCLSQKIITWQDLSNVNFETTFFEAYGDYFLVPSFPDAIKAMHGKEITIEGFFLDVLPGQQIFLISKNPMSTCFFCGMAGPETAIELTIENAKGFKTDQWIRARGIFILNENDVEHCNYILKDVSIEKVDRYE